MIEPGIFRANDIRGKVGQDLTDEAAGETGRAFGSYVRQRAGNRVYVAHDNRPSSPQLAARLIQGLLAAGCDVLELGLVPTPLLYFASATDEGSYGVMVTGSHLPVTCNGFKLCLDGQTLGPDAIIHVRDLAVARDYVTGCGTRSPSPSTVAQYLSRFQPVQADRPPLKVVVDCQNGAASGLAPGLFETLGVAVDRLHCDLTAPYPFERPDPQLLANLEPLRQRVMQVGADAGVAYDGDADRLGVVDNQGHSVAADRVVAILAGDVLRQNPGAKVVYDILSSQVLVDAIEKQGGVPLASESGHTFIKARMRAEGALLGGEYSGHIFFADRYFGYDDGIYASYRLVDLLSRSEQSLAELDEALPRMYTSPEERPYCPDREKYQIVAEVRAAFEAEGRRLITTESSVRVIFDQGWGLVRASNTEPVLSLRFEAHTAQDLERYREIGWRTLAQAGRSHGIEFGSAR